MASLDILSIVLPLVCVISSAAGQNEAAEKYVAEAYVVFDEFALAKYSDSPDQTGAILHDASFYLTFVNEIYRTMNQYGLDIEIRIVRMDVAEEGILLPKGAAPKTLAHNGLLTKFVEWQADEHKKRDLDYDLAILYTGLKMTYGEEDMAGIANMGTICSHDAGRHPSAVITFGPFNTALTTAHELGHIFGATHRGKANYNVMSQGKSFDRSERFSFSKCTAERIKQNLREKGSRCLLETSPISTDLHITVETYKGSQRDPHAVCRREFGKDAHVCTTFNWPGVPGDPGDLNCLRFYCSRTRFGKCERVQTTEGMACDKDKICKMGQCIPDTTGFAKNTIPGCIFGNDRAIYITGSPLSCDEAHALKGGYSVCSQKNIDKCCATCKKLEIPGAPGCYGDAPSTPIAGQGELDCPTIVSRWGAKFACNHEALGPRCCKTCHGQK